MCITVIKKFSVNHHIFCNSKWANPFQDPEVGQQFLTHSQNGSKPETVVTVILMRYDIKVDTYTRGKVIYRKIYL